MPYFAVYALDAPGRLADRQRLRPGHRERLRTHDHPVTVRIGGPLLDAAGEMNGTLLIIEAESRTEVEAYMAGDPYVQAGLFAALDIRAFNWGLGLPDTAHG